MLLFWPSYCLDIGDDDDDDDDDDYLVFYICPFQHYLSYMEKMEG